MYIQTRLNQVNLLNSLWRLIANSKAQHELRNDGYVSLDELVSSALGGELAFDLDALLWDTERTPQPVPSARMRRHPADSFSRRID
jgi:hypothetical protein